MNDLSVAGMVMASLYYTRLLTLLSFFIFLFLFPFSNPLFSPSSVLTNSQFEGFDDDADRIDDAGDDDSSLLSPRALVLPSPSPPNPTQLHPLIPPCPTRILTRFPIRTLHLPSSKTYPSKSSRNRPSIPLQLLKMPLPLIPILNPLPTPNPLSAEIACGDGRDFQEELQSFGRWTAAMATIHPCC
ncbi:uncharacterized protein LOC125472866 [Pyrus x bretschneideri]|uniref:uncharacterized protein LOC125472866 n=1 Tax=Pyrus x bretschneideri TaxID=225117 RepID=UPI00202DF3E9|nr:uncharacterized protein LOC125472866 [Pyrus x bretschneideri]